MPRILSFKINRFYDEIYNKQHFRQILFNKNDIFLKNSGVPFFAFSKLRKRKLFLEPTCKKGSFDVVFAIMQGRGANFALQNNIFICKL